MVADVNGVKVYREVDILPHVVIMFDMVIKTIGTTLKLMTSNTTDKANILLVLFCSILQKRKQCQGIHIKAVSSDLPVHL